jgi:hypothetical protein
MVSRAARLLSQQGALSMQEFTHYWMRKKYGWADHAQERPPP